MKKCSKCKIEKCLLEFSKDKSTQDGYQYKCKSCEKEYRQNNKDNIKKYLKEYYKSNKEYISKKKKEYEKINKEIISKKKKLYREANKEIIANYRKANKEKYSKYNKKYRKKYYKDNKEKISEYFKNWLKQKKQTDPLFKLKTNLRTRTYSAFKNKGYSKNTKTHKMLGVDWNIAKQHIERQFTKGMNWSNHGEWHIDHIIPLASANTEQRLKELCHYSNLQPMWASENISKSDKINGQQTKIRI